MSFRTTILVCVVGAGLAASLAGCGKIGELQRPGPLNGVGTATTKRSDEAVRQATDPSRPVDTIDPRDRVLDPRPPRTLPIGGANPDPNSQPPPGALPNPYANPR